VQVVLGGQDYVKRFRNALAKLDEKGRVQNGQCVSYINMTTGRSAILGLDRCPAGFAAASEAAAAPQDSASVQPAAHAEPSTAARRAAQTPAAAREQPPKGVKKQDAARPSTAAVRPRRAETKKEH
jgi:hypothetical protein